jgi:hypothetical protein
LKAATNQLSLFDAIQEDFLDLDQLLTDKANLLLDMLNDGLKKNLYVQNSYMQIANKILLVATNNDKDFLFNVVDLNGNTPIDFSANWRTAQHVKHELFINE